LLVTDTAGEQERCHLLESTRAYVLEKLAAAANTNGWLAVTRSIFVTRRRRPTNASA